MNKNKAVISIIIFLLILLLSNCRTMMVNQTAETLKPKQKESTFYTGIGLGIDKITPSLKFQFGYQQRFGLSDNIEFQFFLYNDFDISAAIFLSNNLKITPKFRIYHTDKYHLSLLPSVGIYHVLHYCYITRYLGPYAGLTLISSHNIKKDKFSIYYGFGAEIGESFLETYNGITAKNRSETFLIDLSLGTSLGFEVLKNNLVTRHEIGVTTSFDFERDYFFQHLVLKHLLVSVVYGFSVGGRYPRQTIEQ